MGCVTSGASQITRSPRPSKHRSCSHRRPRAQIQLCLISLLLAFAATACADDFDWNTLASSLRSEAVEPIKVLVITATHGYRHGAAITATTNLIRALNGTTEFQFEQTEDLDHLNTDNLARFDLLLFANSTLRTDAPEHPVTASHRAAILHFLQEGGGMAVAHSGLDALYGWPAYRDLVGGGLFESHPWTQAVRIHIEQPDHPATRHLGDELTITDEIYKLDFNPRPNVQVLASLDTASIDLNQDKSEIRRTEFPISWWLCADGAPVFVTKLGHFAEVWQNPAFVQHLLQGMRMAAGRLGTGPLCRA